MGGFTFSVCESIKKRPRRKEMTIHDDRKARERIEWKAKAEEAWRIFTEAYPAYNLDAIKGFMLSEDYWSGGGGIHFDTPDTQSLLESVAYHEARGSFRALPDEWVEKRQLEAAEEAEEARKQRKGVLIRELLGLQKEHTSPAVYAMLTSKYQIWDVPLLEQELAEVIRRRELGPLSKEQLHAVVKKGNTPAPQMLQLPESYTPQVIKALSAEQLKALNKKYGKLVNDRLGVVPRPQVGSMVRSSDR
jgi:hypothetical protein